jgi:predicted phage-related endonuclease
MTREQFRLKNIESHLKELKRAKEEIVPVHVVVDRRLKSLELNIKALEDEREKLKQGQLQFDDDYDPAMGF